MSRLRTRPPLFRGRKNQTSTNAVRREISNSALGGRDASDDNFSLDSYLSAFKSTQQLELDFSKFENHAFFSPARAKVDLALFKAINQFPYTGSRSEIDNFLTKLTGFERFVFDSIPRNIGYLFFSGTNVGQTSGGTSISVKPYKGYRFPGAPGASGEAALAVNKSPFEIEAHLYVPQIQNDNQVIAQRIQNEAGFTLALSMSVSTAECNLLFLVSSASDSYVVASGSINKGEFNHIRACLENKTDGKQAVIYLGNSVIASSSDIQDFGDLLFDTSSLVIGSGSRHSVLDYTFRPRHTLSGAIDEFRFFVDQRSAENVEKYSNSEIFATSSLKLYFRFDEPSGSFDMNNVALDYSGQCLHTEITNFSQALRSTGSIDAPLQFQNAYYSPVLYPDYTPFYEQITSLISSASDYDEENPNIVTNMIPIHYLNESAVANGLSSFDSGLGVIPVLENVPGTGEIPRSSPLISLISLMSIQLDEIKQFVDSMSSLLAIELGEEDQLSSQMIRYAADYFGIDLPGFFAKSTTDQFTFGESVESESLSTYTLRSLRDDLWRRILANMPYANSSKGTRSSIRSILLSSGIVPENFFTIREYGMSGEARLSDLRDQSVEVTSMVDFSGSLITPTGSFVSSGFRQDSQRIIGSYLTASRVEIGFPEIAGGFIDKEAYYPHGISDNLSDGLLTSGSFSLEASYVFDRRISHPSSQSLMRIMTTGSYSPGNFVVANLIYSQDTDASGTLTAGIRPSSEGLGVTPSELRLILTGVNLFDGDRWTVGIERSRNDDIESEDLVENLYTLRCAKQAGNQVFFFSTSSFYSDTSFDAGQNVFQNQSSDFNASGSYIVIGSQSIDAGSVLLNSASDFLYSIFTGKVSHIKFASSKTGDASFIEHSRNFSSIGLENPELGLGFDLVQTGAFSRLRVDASCDQATTSSDSAGNIRIFDFSQNGLHLSGSGFGANYRVISPYVASVDRISPRFDLQQVSNKVRPRGLNVPSQTDPTYTIAGPVYEIYDTNEIIDDVRFSIEHSIVKALNEDMISTIGTSQYIDESLGQPIELFNDSYARFDHFKDVYFRRMTSKIDFMRTYDVFRWVDVALSNLVESMLPKRTKFMGITYIIEPHLAERGKIKYYFQESFMTTNMDGQYETYSVDSGYYEPID
jgi:hypothetical protein